MANFRRVMILDTETTGLPKSRFANISNSENWPHIVQLAWIVCERRGTKRTDLKFKEVFSNNIVIKPEKWTIPVESSNIHGITHSQAERIGIPIDEAIYQIRRSFDKYEIDAICCHNVAFDIKILLAEEHRLGYNWEMSPFNKIPKLCTMELSRDIVKLPFNEPHPKSRFKYKAPRLEELYKFLYEKEYDGGQLHDAMVDCEVTRLVLEKMIND